MSTRELLAACALVALAASPARAQVNAETLRPDPYRAGWSGGLDASFALLRGNVELVDVGGAARVQYQTLHPRPLGEDGAPLPDAVPWVEHRVFATVNGRWSEVFGRVFTSRAFAHARWTGMWHPNVGSDVFLQGQLDELQHLRARVVGGVGVRVEIVHEAVFTLAFGTAPMLEYDLIAPVPESTEPPESVVVRWTSYLSARLALLEGGLLAQLTTYVQPRFDRFEDLRSLTELEVLARADAMVSFGATLSVLYDTEPPLTVRDTDVRLASTLRISL